MQKVKLRWSTEADVWAFEKSDLPNNAEEAFEVGLDLLDRLPEQPAVKAHADVSHPVDGHQRLHQPAQRVEGRLSCLTHRTRHKKGASWVMLYFYLHSDAIEEEEVKKWSEEELSYK